jgi:prevent-host-death family protein
MSRKEGPTRPERLSVTATEAKNNFGAMLDAITEGKVVVVTRHDAPRAVMLSVDAYEGLAGDEVVDLGALREEFDAFVASLQSPEAPARLQAAFEATPEEVGRAALEAAQEAEPAGA